MLDELHKLAGENFPIQSIIETTIKTTEPILAPNYWLFPETTEQNQIQQAINTYGVQLKE